MLCCYVTLHPETARRLARYAPGTRFADVSGDLTAYWEQLSACWGDAEDLVNIDHDIGIHAAVLPEFAACPQLWCVFPYPHVTGLLDSGLGCARFRREAMAQVAPEDILAGYGSCADCRGEIPGCWMHLEGKIAAALEARNVGRHVHMPPVDHYRAGVTGV